MEAFYFGDSGHRLLGVRFEPGSAAKHTGVLICPSWGMEFTRSYRSLSLLARQLAERGFDTLRFDYSCTGDSGGDSTESSVDQWIADIDTAARELTEISRCERVCLLGLRVGGLLASEAVRRGLRVDGLALWDTPSSGAAWLQQMREIELSYYASKNRYRAPNNQLAVSADELIGIPLPVEQAQRLSAFTPNFKASVSTRELLSADQIPGTPDEGVRLTLPESAHWQDHNWLTTPWTPVASMRVIGDHFASWLR